MGAFRYYAQRVAPVIGSVRHTNHRDLLLPQSRASRQSNPLQIVLPGNAQLRF